MLRIATGSESGAYYKIGAALAEKVRQEDLAFTLEVKATSGSVDNIHLLRSGKVDLAVVQNDIAYLAERGQAPFSQPVQGLRGLLMLYSEPILVFSNQPSLGRLSSSLPSPVGTGPQGSGLSFNSLTILKAAEAWDSVTTKAISPDLVAQALATDEVRLAFANRLDDSLLELLDNGRARLVSLQSSLRQALTNTYPYYEPYTLELASGEWNGIAVRSMVIARSDLRDDPARQLIRLLLDHEDELVRSAASNLPLAASMNPVKGMPLADWHPSAEEALSKRELILRPSTSTWLLWSGGVLLALLGLYLFLNLVAALARRRSRPWLPAQSRVFYRLKRLNLFVFRWKYLCLALLLVTQFTYIVLCIEHLESRPEESTHGRAHSDLRMEFVRPQTGPQPDGQGA